MNHTVASGILGALVWQYIAANNTGLNNVKAGELCSQDPWKCLEKESISCNPRMLTSKILYTQYKPSFFGQRDDGTYKKDANKTELQNLLWYKLLSC
jgi:hypothetical protein